VSSAIPRRDFRGRRWLNVVLRGLHLVVVFWLGALLMGAPAGISPHVVAAAVFFSGALMWSLDIWHRPEHLREWAGVSMVLKLVAVAAMIFAPNWRELLFWSIVVWSAVFSHAPGSFRNAPVLRR